MSHSIQPPNDHMVQGLDGWGVTYTRTKICALKGSTVEMKCNYTYPYSRHYHSYYVTIVKKTLWFTEEDNEPVELRSKSKGRVRSYDYKWYYSSNKPHSRLRISDLRESDSAVYKFRFITNQPGGEYTGEPGVSLTVTDLHVQVIRSIYQSSSWAELKCVSSCPLAGRPSYVWYRNGQKMKEGTSPSYADYFNYQDSYSCAVKGHEDFRSPSINYPLDAPKVPSVLVSPSGEIVEGSSVTLTCSSDANPAATYTWYKKNGNPDQEPFRTGPQLDFVSIQSSDSAEFYCTVQNKLGKKTSDSTSIDVKYGPKMPSLMVRPSGEIVEGSSVTLTCSSDADPPVHKYTWYRENQTLLQGPERSYNFSSISSEDTGTYHCQSENQHGRINSSSVLIDVQCK
uniref:Ig-like domain-containing protein n=1 Tax=Myripristis murdjan TaxID=586833 RepID=A0A668A7C8_9TELE